MLLGLHKISKQMALCEDSADILHLDLEACANSPLCYSINQNFLPICNEDVFEEKDDEDDGTVLDIDSPRNTPPDSNQNKSQNQLCSFGINMPSMSSASEGGT